MGCGHGKKQVWHENEVVDPRRIQSGSWQQAGQAYEGRNQMDPNYYSVAPKGQLQQASGGAAAVMGGHCPEDLLEVNDKQFPGGKRLVPMLNPTVGQSRLLQRRLSEGSVASDAETRSPRSPDSALMSPKSVGSGPAHSSQSFSYTEPGSERSPYRQPSQ